MEWHTIKQVREALIVSDEHVGGRRHERMIKIVAIADVRLTRLKAIANDLRVDERRHRTSGKSHRSDIEQARRTAPAAFFPQADVFGEPPS